MIQQGDAQGLTVPLFTQSWSIERWKWISVTLRRSIVSMLPPQHPSGQHEHHKLPLHAPAWPDQHHNSKLAPCQTCR